MTLPRIPTTQSQAVTVPMTVGMIEVNATRVDITPLIPVTFGAGFSTERLSTGVRESLEANIGVLADGDNVLILVAVDLLYPGPILRQSLEVAFPEIPPANIFLAASHTHRAPLATPCQPGLGTISQEYVDFVSSLLITKIKELLLEERQPVSSLDVGKGKLNHSINRRLISDGHSRMAPNPDGVTDELASVLVVKAQGLPVFVLWNYACHPVSDPDRYLVAAHFPAHVRSAFRSHFNDVELPVLYLQGFSGNTRPSGTTRVKRPIDVLRRIKWGPLFHDFSRGRYERWSTSLSDSVLQLLSVSQSRPPGQFSAARLERPLSEFATGKAGGSVSFHAICLSDVITLVGVSGEVVAEYAAWARAQSESSPHTMCVGCIDDTFGYIPVASMIEEGGYESSGFCRNFGLESVNPNVESHTKSAIGEVLRAVR